MHTWEDKPYWIIADDIAHNAYRQLFSQIVVRGTNYFSKCIPRDYNFSNLSHDNQINIDFVHTIATDSKLWSPDNIATCLAYDDFCEIEIMTLLPSGYKIKTLLNNKKFHWDFINVVRHELEHMCQGCNFKNIKFNQKIYDKSNINFLLETDEVPAYVHGFRICTASRQQFLNEITNFVSIHGKNLKLSSCEIENTIKTWYDYLSKLNYHSDSPIEEV